jgi:hypothetical protein
MILGSSTVKLGQELLLLHEACMRRRQRRRSLCPGAKLFLGSNEGLPLLDNSLLLALGWCPLGSLLLGLVWCPRGLWSFPLYLFTPRRHDENVEMKLLLLSFKIQNRN